ncbi:DUF502 domain-containing protein [Aureliella helgolandensis]|uniref:DUF502 domain-containing protein n=1 Tax=Aureliella helgolandensis TaxID=2527968 RepID=A0A518G5A1_9BACT|nr:DUF502 domain-containing protein [Aureliella helgolandensis]QDV23773.1 hypothetical protein Q31a_20780 [Aureliella helgolandensis]
MDSDNLLDEAIPKPRSSWQRAIWRGSSIIAPPLVTLLLLIWIASAVEQYVLLPLESGARTLLVWTTSDVLLSPPEPSQLAVEDQPEKGFEYGGLDYVQAPLGGKFLPEYVVQWVNHRLDMLPIEMQNPRSAQNYYHAYIKLRYMPRWFTIPLLLLVLLSVLYFVGRFLAAGVGRFFVTAFERIIHQLPIVRNLYSSVKQVTDFVLSEREIEFTRVVAVEYPRVGIWSLGFVTSDSLPQLKDALNEEMVAIFIPTSPMPMTGFTINVRKRDVVDLELTIDQAIQFIVSCGVVCPPTAAARLRSGGRPLLKQSSGTPPVSKQED